MCGLFGLLRCPGAAHPEDASQAFVLLGVMAEERGLDGAGVALLSGRTAAGPAPAGAIRARDVRLDGCRVVKGTGRFSRMWRPDLEGALDHAELALGHTRWATQGGIGLANASPLLTGTLAGTHNGDVDARALRARFGVPRSQGGTDSEVIFQALAGSDEPAGRLKVLSAMVGRAALAWADRASPGRVHLTRAALTPLVVAYDSEGNLWWASNPQWLRVAARETPVRLTRMLLLAEGTYAVFEAGSRRPRIVARRRFVPLTRPHDVRFQPGVWRGFTAADRKLAQRPDLQRHVVTRPGAAGQPAAPGLITAASG